MHLDSEYQSLTEQYNIIRDALRRQESALLLVRAPQITHDYVDPPQPHIETRATVNPQPKKETMDLPPIINAILKSSPHSPVAKALLRKNFPSLVIPPDMEADQIRDAIAALPAPPPKRTTAPRHVSRIEETRSVNVSFEEITAYTVGGSGRYTACVEDDVEVPVSVIREGSDAVDGWLRDWWSDNSGDYQGDFEIEEAYSGDYQDSEITEWAHNAESVCDALEQEEEEEEEDE